MCQRNAAVFAAGNDLGEKLPVDMRRVSAFDRLVIEFGGRGKIPGHGKFEVICLDPGSLEHHS